MNSYSLFEWIAFFMIYCFIGWLGESIYVSIEHRKLVNRGFLHGPFLPIYGTGAVMILISTLHVRNSLILTFLLGMLGATILEYATGYVMEQIFQVKYWDYTYQPFNINGYVCLGCSLTWGFCAVLLTRHLHNHVERLVLGCPNIILIIVDIIFVINFTADAITSAQEAFDLKKMILESKELQRLQKRFDVYAAFAQDDRERFEAKLAEYRHDKEERLIMFKEEKKHELEKIKEELAVARERYNAGYEKAKRRAKRILKRNPGALSFKHELNTVAIREIFFKNK